MSTSKAVTTMLEQGRRANGAYRFASCETEQIAARTYLCELTQRHAESTVIYLENFSWRQWKMIDDYDAG